jgi:class 3 adenylate cyclase
VVNTLELQVARGPQRLPATVLFTDIVGSTERAPGGGGRSCSTAMTRAAHRLVERQGGRLIKSTGDGILAVCDTQWSNGIIDREEADHGRQAGCTGTPGLR